MENVDRVNGPLDFWDCSQVFVLEIFETDSSLKSLETKTWEQSQKSKTKTGEQSQKSKAKTEGQSQKSLKQRPESSLKSLKARLHDQRFPSKTWSKFFDRVNLH
jgi:hypothetical protein